MKFELNVMIRTSGCFFLPLFLTVFGPAHSIIERLKTLGWAEDIEKMPSHIRMEFRQLKWVNKPQPLTERIWTNISADILEYMKKTKALQLLRDLWTNRRTRCELLRKFRKAYLRTQPPNTILPPPVDIALMPLFTKVIEQGLSETDFGDQQFEEPWRELPELTSEWRAKVVKHILSSDDSLRTEQDLQLATKRISCMHCGQVPRYPALLSHTCYVYRPGFGVDGLTVEEKILSSMGRTTMAKRKFKVSQDARAEMLLSLCGLDPSTTLYEDLVSLNPLLECHTRACANRPTRLIMNFPRMASRL